MNEREFCNLFSGFWQQALPNLESITRTFNLGPERDLQPMVSSIFPSRRDIVSETAFHLVGAVLGGQIISAPETLGVAFEAASNFLQSASNLDRKKIAKLSDIEVAEVQTLASRTRRFLLGLSLGRDVVFMPRFSGHGAIEACNGDFAVDEILVEVKCVDRTFRSTDFRQLLTYSALRYFADAKKYSRIAAYNPLRGTYVLTGLDEIIYSCSGKSAEEFFHELSYTLASGQISR
jgi:hypothetical protein